MHKWKRLDKEGGRREREYFVLRGKAEKAPKHLVEGLQKKTKNSERDDARGAQRAKKKRGEQGEEREDLKNYCRVEDCGLS